MGALDVSRQAPNVKKMKMLGAEVVPVHSGNKTLKDATNEAYLFKRDKSMKSKRILHSYSVMSAASAGKDSFMNANRNSNRISNRVSGDYDAPLSIVDTDPLEELKLEEEE